jgi:hypothetical protein
MSSWRSRAAVKPVPPELLLVRANELLDEWRTLKRTMVALSAARRGAHRAARPEITRPTPKRTRH